MSVAEGQPPPDRAEMTATIKVIDDHAERIFSWNYDRDRDQLVTLYNKAMGSQWNSITELDWSIDVDPELTSSFGEFRLGHFHAGIDLSTFGRQGAPVFAVDEGEPPYPETMNRAAIAEIKADLIASMG